MHDSADESDRDTARNEIREGCKAGWALTVVQATVREETVGNRLQLGARSVGGRLRLRLGGMLAGWITDSVPRFLLRFFSAQRRHALALSCETKNRATG